MCSCTAVECRCGGCPSSRRSVNDPDLKTHTVVGPEYRISVNVRGVRSYTRGRLPQKRGMYSEIVTPSATLQFNLNHEIVRARGNGCDWPSELEWLKRTAGNDWVFYSAGGYGGRRETLGEDLPNPVSFRVPAPYNETYKLTGEYYVPNLPYPSNVILGCDGLKHPVVARLSTHWPSIVRELNSQAAAQGPFAGFLRRVLRNSGDRLRHRAQELFAVTQGRMTAIPPDTRHVDYDVLPLIVSDGCLYKCSFCRVKDSKPFAVRSLENVAKQISGLRSFYGRDLINYNSVLLGGHDALSADRNSIIRAATLAIDELGLHGSFMKGCNLFMFGSVDALLQTDAVFFDRLNALCCRTYINIGLESADQDTLDALGKPLCAENVISCFRKMQQINKRYKHIEMTGNFVTDDALPSGHERAFLNLVRDGFSRPTNKGSIYLSPLCKTPPTSHTVFRLNQLRAASRLPTFVYAIQRL